MRWQWISALVGGAALAGGAYFYMREQGVETPRYDVLKTDGAIELRRYRPYLVAETVQRGAEAEARSRGFSQLARYIFAQPGGRADAASGGVIAMTAPVTTRPVSAEPIAMTAPVTSRPADAADEWRISFMMPSQWTRDTLPPPGAGIDIADQPERTLAVIRFPGVARADLLAGKEAELREWIRDRALTAAGTA